MSSGDSMLRDNLWEWPRFKSGNNSSNFTFANNPEGCFDYWAKRAGEARDYEGIYDIGMRGLQDVALLGYEGQEAQLAGLKDIIECQRKIITDSLGGDPTKVPQIYIPYKEALTLYNAGLKIPDDVTLCWVDDNYAYIFFTREEEYDKHGEVIPNSGGIFVMCVDITKGTPTGISATLNEKGEMRNENWFNLNGQRVGNSYKGVVVTNGKKLINK